MATTLIRLFFLGSAVALSSCASSTGVLAGGKQGTIEGRNSAPEMVALEKRLAALAPSVHPADAKRAAESAYATSEQLAREYNARGPGTFQNFLVNAGLRKRGLCYQWTEDLIVPLNALHLRTLRFQWGVAREGTLGEHNCVVATAIGQPFADGIILDAWRHSGKLFWAAIADDPHYPWHKDLSIYAYERTAQIPPARRKNVAAKGKSLVSARVKGVHQPE